MTLIHTVATKCQSLCLIGVTIAHLSSERHYVYALWFKVTRTRISPELDNEPDNVASFLCVVFCGCNKSELVYNFQL
jgi:hypothetical protein